MILISLSTATIASIITWILPVFCSCKRPENRFYFECTGCKIWFNPDCQNMAQAEISDDPQELTYCTACQAQQSGKGEEDWIVSSASVSLCLGSTHTSSNFREVSRLRPRTRFGEHVSGNKTPGFSRLAWSISVIKAFFSLKLLCSVCLRLNLNLIVTNLSKKLTKIRNGFQQNLDF